MSIVSYQTIDNQPQKSLLNFNSFEATWKTCEIVSKSSFCPKDFQNRPGDILCAMQYGMEIGLSPMQSLHGIAVVNGRPSVWGDTLLALCQSSPECEYIKEGYDEKEKVAFCKAKRRNHPEIERMFSEKDAERAGLLRKSGPWSLYTKRMLQMRARSFCLRDAFSFILKGVIDAEEAQDFVVNDKVEVVSDKKSSVVDIIKDKVKNLAENIKSEITNEIEAAINDNDLQTPAENISIVEAEKVNEDKEQDELNEFLLLNKIYSFDSKIKESIDSYLAKLGVQSVEKLNAKQIKRILKGVAIKYRNIKQQLSLNDNIILQKLGA